MFHTNIDNKEESRHGGVWELPVISLQFFYKSKYLYLHLKKFFIKGYIHGILEKEADLFPYSNDLKLFIKLRYILVHGHESC